MLRLLVVKVWIKGCNPQFAYTSLAAHLSFLPIEWSTRTKFMHPSDLRDKSDCSKLRAVHVPAKILHERQSFCSALICSDYPHKLSLTSTSLWAYVVLTLSHGGYPRWPMHTLAAIESSQRIDHVRRAATLIWEDTIKTQININMKHVQWAWFQSKSGCQITGHATSISLKN